MKKIIKDYKWELLYDHLNSAIVPMIREFYANGHERNGFTITVRGKSVSFDHSTINRYYGLANIEDDEYQPSIENDGIN